MFYALKLKKKKKMEKIIAEKLERKSFLTFSFGTFFN